MTDKLTETVERLAPMSVGMAEVVGIVMAMNTAWMRREETLRLRNGFEAIEAAADLMDSIVDRVPELQRKLLAALSRPNVDEMKEALTLAFDFLGGVDDASEIRGRILAALRGSESRG